MRILIIEDEIIAMQTGRVKQVGPLYEFRREGNNRVIVGVERGIYGGQRVYTVAEGEVAERIGNTIATAILILAVAAGVAMLIRASRD